MSCSSYPATVVLCLLSRPSCAVLSFLAILSHLPAGADLSRLSCPNCLYSPAGCPSCPVPAALSRLSVSVLLAPSSPVRTANIPTVLAICLVPAFLSCIPCPSCHVLAAQSSLNVESDLSRLTFQLPCPGHPVQADMSQLSYPDNPAPAVLSCQLSRPGCPVPVFLFFLCCPKYPVLSVIFWPSSLPCLIQADVTRLIPFFPWCLVRAVMPRLSCIECPVKVVLSWLPYPSCSVLSCSGRPLISFLQWLVCHYRHPSCPVSAVLSRMPCLFVLYRLSWVVLTWLSYKTDKKY
jgi:hypothetical protein